jgi:phosphoribosylanthranilate isomerase
MSLDQDLFIKVCGVTNIADAELACSLGADAVGFVFNTSSEWNISPEHAALIAAKLPEHISKIGVFESASQKFISDICKRVPLSAAQVFGSDAPDDLVGYEISVIKAFRLDRSFDLEIMRNYLVDAFLLESRNNEQSELEPKEYHWDIAAKAKEFGKIIISGGLHPDNIEDAVKFVKPYGVDVRTGVEKEPGKKDPLKLRDFIANARNASQLYGSEGEDE